MKFPFLQKKVSIFNEGHLSNDGNSPSICSDFKSIYQKQEQRDFDDSAKNKNRETETERGVKKKDKNNSDELTVEANDTPIQMFSSFEVNRGLRHWSKH